MYAVGFAEDSLAEYNHNDNFYYFECRYIHDIRDGLKAATEILADIIIPLLIEEWTEGADNSLIDLRLNELISIYALSFKKHSFSYEHEVRLVIICSEDDRSIKFRPKGNILIPYIELEIDRYALKEIKVGPVEHQDLAMHSLSLFARSVTDELVRSGSVDIEYEPIADESAILYRSL